VTEGRPSDGGEPEPEPEEDEKKMTPLDRARWVGAFIVGAVALFLVSRSYFEPTGQVCRQEVGDGAKVVTLCRPIGLEDALWVGLVGLVVVLLLLKDFSEVSVTGIGSLKRTVEETKKKTDEQEKKTAELERFVIGLGLSVANSVSNNISINNNYGPAPTTEELKQARDDVPLPASERDLRRAAAPDISPERAVKLTQVLDLYERMAYIFGTVTGPRRYPGVVDPEARILIDHPKVLAWYREFNEPWKQFRAARQAAAHNPASLPDEALQAAVELGERLLFSLQEAVRDLISAEELGL
jgi:hypothetical protein